jgi:Pyruvate/2-oxoacid:ferredoxin oxidoreductase gamma subunit
VFPEVRIPDIIICLSEEAFRHHAEPLAPGGMRPVDAAAAADADRGQPGTVVLPIVATARARGPHGAVAANVVALGALLAHATPVTEASLRRALRERVRPALLERNDRALDAGLRIGGHAAGAEKARATSCCSVP